MEGVRVVGAGPRVRGRKSPVEVSGKASVGSLGTNPPDADTKCEISVQF